MGEFEFMRLLGSGSVLVYGGARLLLSRTIAIATRIETISSTVKVWYCSGQTFLAIAPVFA